MPRLVELAVSREGYFIHRFILAAISLSLALLLASCGSAPSPVHTTSSLEPGGGVEVGGIRFRAEVGALDGAVEVFAEPSGAPSSAPLPAGLKAVGTFVDVGARGDVATNDGAALQLGVPIPSGADRAHLGLAILVPADATEADAVPGTAPDRHATWFVAKGVVDAGGQRFEVPFGYLAAAGRTTVLVNGPNLVSSTAATTAEPAATTIDFHANCSGEFSKSGVSESCSSADEAAAKTALEQVYNDLKARGFHAPRLSGSAVFRNGRLVYESYDVKLRPCSQTGDFLGMYTALANGFGTIWVCIGNGGFSSGSEPTLRHEFFHATQYGYHQVFHQVFQGKKEVWWVEGMAVSSEFAIPSPRRDGGRARRVIDRSLTREKDQVPDPSNPGTTRKRYLAYQSQDFWVHLMDRLGGNLEDLIPVIARGPNVASLGEALSQDVPSPTTLTSVYLRWARDQAIEASIDLGNGAPGAPCTLHTGVLSNSNGLLLTTAFAPDAAQAAPKTFTLPPLASGVVRFELPAYADGDYNAIAEVTSTTNDVKVAFYDQADAGTTACQGTSGTSQFGNVLARMSAGRSGTRYAVVSNTSQDTSHDVSAYFAGQPRITINEPSASSYREGSSLTLQANATGFADPSAVTVTWTYDGGSVLTTSDSGQSVTASFPTCYSGVLTATASDGSASVSDATTVSCTPQHDQHFYNAQQDVSGSVDQGGNVTPISGVSEVHVGDDASDVGSVVLLTFPLNMPGGLARITQATLTLDILALQGAPYDLGGLKAYQAGYGDTLDAGDLPPAGFYPGAGTFPQSTGGLVSIDVTTAVQDAWANRGTRGDRVQFYLRLTSSLTDNDSIADYVRIGSSDRVGTFEIPALEVSFDNF